jgi:hypothetical protein
MAVKKKMSIGCGLVALFGLGVVAGLVSALFLVGGIAKRTQAWDTEASRTFITNHLAGVMDFDEGQKEKLAPIVDDAFAERWALRQEYREETDQLFVEKYWPRVQEIADEEQEAKLRKRWLRWRKEKEIDAGEVPVK